MQPRPRPLLLPPGLDGAEVFLRPLPAALPRWMQARVLEYPEVRSDVQAQLRARARLTARELPNCHVRIVMSLAIRSIVRSP